MKMYEIALFLLIFNIAIALVNVSGAFPSEYNKQPDENFISTGQEQIEGFNASTVQVSEGNDYIQAVGNALGGLFMFISVVFYSTVAIGPTISGILGNSAEAQQLGNYIAAIVYFIYITALVQIWANRGFRGMR